MLEGHAIVAFSKICRVRLLFLRVGPAGTYFGCFTMWETTFARNSHAGLGRPVYEPSILASMVKAS